MKDAQEANLHEIKSMLVEIQKTFSDIQRNKKSYMEAMRNHRKEN